MRAAPNGRSRSCATGRMPPAVADRTPQTARWRPVARGLHVVSDRAEGYARNTRAQAERSFGWPSTSKPATSCSTPSRRFVTERLRPLRSASPRTDAIPPEIVAEMRALGLFGLSIPEEYGGLGLTMEEEALVAFELGRTSPAFRSLFGTNVGIGTQGIVHGRHRRSRRRKWLPRLASGELDHLLRADRARGRLRRARSLQHERPARRRPLCAQRHQALHHQRAARPALFTVMARTDPKARARRGVSAFLVEAQHAGHLARQARQEDGPAGRARPAT